MLTGAAILRKCVMESKMKIIKDELSANDQLLGTNHFLSADHKQMIWLIWLISSESTSAFLHTLLVQTSMNYIQYFSVPYNALHANDSEPQFQVAAPTCSVT